MRFSYARVLILLSLILAFAIAGIPSESQAPTCKTTNGSGFTIQLCIQAPANNAVVSGNVVVAITRTRTGTHPGVIELAATLNGAHLISDYTPHYIFELPTTHFVDGTYTLGVKEVLAGGFETDETTVNLTFANGITSVPVNTDVFTPHRPSGSQVLVAATGDGASGQRPQVTDMIASWDPDMFLYLGDVYEKGTWTEFRNWYGTNSTYFGQFYDITNPTVGNHEYEGDGVAAAYFYYWDNVPHYYSYNVAGWHIVTLDSNLEFNQLKPGTPQYQWLAQDLTNAGSTCVMITLHHPPLRVGSSGVNTTVGKDFWPLFAANGVDVVLSAHYNQYQRWHPLDADGDAAMEGPVQFVVGTGGRRVREFDDTDSRMAVGYDTSPEAYGALRFQLSPTGMSYQYINIAGAVLDSGTLTCAEGSALLPPSQPAIVSPRSGDTIADATPVFQWTENPAAEQVTQYKIVVKRANGEQIFARKLPDGACTSGTCSFDAGAAGIQLNNGGYKWFVQAKNGAGKAKSANQAITIEFPGAATLVEPADELSTTDRSPQFRWSAVAAAAQYQLRIKKQGTNVYSHWFDAAAVNCDGTSCWIDLDSIPMQLPFGQLKWRVDTRNLAGGTGKSTSEWRDLIIVRPPG